jgi:uncharacterized protein
MKRWPLLTALLLALTIALFSGCAALDERQRAWIFQPSDRSWGSSGDAALGMDDVWIEFQSKASGSAVKLHGLWLADADDRQSDSADTRGKNLNDASPVMLYLHGARWNVAGSASRMRRMQELGFSVLAIDYRGFGKSSKDLPSEAMAVEDARAAWNWLAAKYPQRPRYIFGHSLGGAIAIELATQVDDETGTIVEGTFTSIPDVASSMKWGWLPVGPLITQRFESVRKVDRIGSPLLVVHGTNDQLIVPELGRRLFDAAKEPKAFVLVDGGSHFNTNAVGQGQYRKALAQLFNFYTGLPAMGAPGGTSGRTSGSTSGSTFRSTSGAISGAAVLAQ